MKAVIQNELWEWMKALFIAILLAAIIRYFLFAPILVDGESMVPTLSDRDRMIVNKLNYTVTTPKRFDIVVFHANEKQDYIKRVIGLPGDRIEYKNDTLYVNGKPYKEPFIEKYKQTDPTGEPFTQSFELSETPVGQETVPEGHLFVMGDNRRFSKDSRHIGAIPIDEVIGTAKIIYWPLKDIEIIQ